MKKIFVLFTMFALVFSLFATTSFGETEDSKEKVKKDESLEVYEFDVNEKKVKVKVSKEHKELLSDEFLKDLANDFPQGGDIHIYNVGKSENIEQNKEYKFKTPKEHSHDDGDVSTLGTECSYYGLCNAHSHYYVTSVNKTSYGNRGSNQFVTSVAKGQEKTLTSSVTKSSQSSVTGGISNLRSQVSASIVSGTSRTYSTSETFSGMDIQHPNNSRDFYWAGIYDSGTWSGYEERYDQYGTKANYNHTGNFKEYNQYIEFSYDYQR
jgi:hypothetical protein